MRGGHRKREKNRQKRKREEKEKGRERGKRKEKGGRERGKKVRQEGGTKGSEWVCLFPSLNFHLCFPKLTLLSFSIPFQLQSILTLSIYQFLVSPLSLTSFFQPLVVFFRQFLNFFPDVFFEGFILALYNFSIICSLVFFLFSRQVKPISLVIPSPHLPSLPIPSLASH